MEKFDINSESGKYVVVKDEHGELHLVDRKLVQPWTALDRLPLIVKILICVTTWLFFRYCTVPILDLIF